VCGCVYLYRLKIIDKIIIIIIIIIIAINVYGINI